MEQDTTGMEKECSEACCVRGGAESLKQEGKMVEAHVRRRERSDQPLVEYLNTESQLHTAGLVDGFHRSFPQKAVFSPSSPFSTLSDLDINSLESAKRSASC